MNDIAKKVAHNIALFRIKSGMTQKELGEAIGTTGNTVSNWEKEVSKVDIVSLFKICAVLNVSIKDMYEEAYDVFSPPHDKNTAALLASYEKLNEVGKQEAVKRVSELTEIPKYISKKNTKTEFANEILSEEEIEKAGEAYKEGLRLQANSQTSQASS